MVKILLSTWPYANMQLLQPPMQFSTIGKPATLKSFSCEITEISSHFNTPQTLTLTIYIKKPNYLADILVCNNIEGEARFWMTSPSNCLPTILSNTSVVPLEGYFRTAQRTNSDDNLHIGQKEPDVILQRNGAMKIQ